MGAEGQAAADCGLGDSLSSGYGVKPAQSFPAQLQKQLRARGHNVVVTNAGVAGDTTAAGLDRLAWSVPNDADAVIVEFGANDMLRGIDPKQTRANLEKMIAALKKRQVAVLLAGMRAPANWGEDYARAFDAIFPDLAREHELVYLSVLPRWRRARRKAQPRRRHASEREGHCRDR